MIGDVEPIVRVAAAVIVRPDGQVLLAQRPNGKAYAGYWEFPGGKLEPGEAPRHALDRELREELGLAVRRAAPWIVQRYRYPHAHVELHFFRVFEWEGEPVGHDGQAFAWQTPGNFGVEPLLPANTFVLGALLLPAVYGITMAGELGENAFLARARTALDGGLRLFQLREKDWPDDRQRALAGTLGRAGAPARREGAAERRCATRTRMGLRWRALDVGSSWKLRRRGPPACSCAATCHTRADIERAGARGLDFAVLGPYCAMRRIRALRTLGWNGFAAIAAQAHCRSMRRRTRARRLGV